MRKTERERERERKWMRECAGVRDETNKQIQ